MRASELLHDLLGYDDDEREDQCYEYNNNNNNSIPCDDSPVNDSRGEGVEEVEEGEAVKRDFYALMHQQEQQHNNLKQWKYVVSSDVNENECSICLMEQPLTGLLCHHRFCKDCLSFHVKTQIRARNIQHIRCYPRRNQEMIEIHVETVFGVACPHIGCNAVILDLLPFVNKEDLEFFDDKCLDIAILKMRLRGELQPCPRGCGYIVQQNCICVNEDCRKRQSWFQQLNDRQKAAVLLKEKLAMRMAFPHDKKCCPTCLVEISKNGGCDHMHCSMCNTHFSWSAAPEYGLGYEWFKQQTEKLFKGPKLILRSSDYYILTASPFKKRRYYAQLEKSKRENKEKNTTTTQK